MAASIQALSTDEPCGPDLDLEEDGGYFNFIASTDTLLPDSYMQDEDGKRVPFHASQRYQGLDLSALLTGGGKVLGRSHDLRILAIVAKLHILNRSLPRFVATLGDMASLMEAFPAAVHPQEPAARVGACERLNEPLILSALNNAVLFKSRRFGNVTWVSYQAAARADGAGGPDAVDDVLRKEIAGDPGAAADAQALLGTSAAALATIRAACADVAPAQVPDLGKLGGQITALRAFMERVHPTEEGGAPAEETEAPPPAAGPASTPAPRGTLPLLPDGRAAEAALAEAERFFATVEPSSPCLLLLRQAQALAGKSFFEALQVLAPESAEKAVFAFGGAPAFDLPLSRIAAAAPSLQDSDEGEDTTGDDPPSRIDPVTSRGDALALLDQVGAFYRFVEPSSPIPMLVERARALAGKDFAALLKAMMPEKKDESGW